jgi:hypothetical protein
VRARVLEPIRGAAQGGAADRARRLWLVFDSGERLECCCEQCGESHGDDPLFTQDIEEVSLGRRAMRFRLEDESGNLVVWFARGDHLHLHRNSCSASAPVSARRGRPDAACGQRTPPAEPAPKRSSSTTECSKRRGQAPPYPAGEREGGTLPGQTKIRKKPRFEISRRVSTQRQGRWAEHKWGLAGKNQGRQNVCPTILEKRKAGPRLRFLAPLSRARDKRDDNKEAGKKKNGPVPVEGVSGPRPVLTHLHRLWVKGRRVRLESRSCSRPLGSC